MTIEEKAKAYDEAIERAKYYYNEGKTLEYATDVASYIFPKLKESEDEGINKSIIAILNNYIDDSNTFKHKMIAWLEKQGEPKSDKVEPMVYNHYIMSNPNFFQWIYERLVHVYNENPNEHYMLSLKERIEDMQKSSDKVESKFKVGDWVVKKSGNPFEDNRKFARINMIDKEKLWFDCGTWLEDKYLRLWTIQDAKDGDVLASSLDNKPFIFNGCLDSIYVGAYGGLSFSDKFITTDNQPLYHFWDAKINVRPATKEETKRLFNNMKEAGYKWDADKKEPIKL